MKKQIIYFSLALVIIFLSTPLGSKAVDIIFYNRMLASEYTAILNGFIHSFMLIGVLLFIKGIVEELANKKQ